MGIENTENIENTEKIENAENIENTENIESIENVESTLIAVLFAAGEPKTIDDLATILGCDKDILKIEIETLADVYLEKGNGIIIKKINESYQLASNPKYKEYTHKLFEPRINQNLSQATLEVLAIVAYNQGITRAEIEKIRGVNSDSGINSLLERNLIKDAGRLDAPGRPIMYETTDEFLKSFGFASLEELPKVTIYENEEDINDKGDVNDKEKDVNDKGEQVDDA